MASVTSDKTRRICPGADRPAVDALDLDITDGEFLVLVRPSGGTNIIKLASRKIKQLSLATRCQLAGERNCHILCFFSQDDHDHA
jgi:ABC-type proline/glycine betaine transport system ATPase subunit